MYHGILTSVARKASGQKYPIAYASNDLAEKDPKAYKFNCGESPLPPPSRAKETETDPLFCTPYSPASPCQLHREPDPLPNRLARRWSPVPRLRWWNWRALESL